MENAADALKMAFAIFVFIVALSIVFSLIGNVKETADAILYYSDKTNYYQYETGNLENGRIVGIDTVISTLKNYRNQSAYVIIDGKEFNYGANMDAEIDTYITNNIGSSAQYYENIREITTGGQYRIAEDGTKITIRPGTTRTYVIYTKK